ncbi:heterogeneous nuclear ribonucleoprotein 1-like [Salvia splendens]|nr:heterogeneous nuclear ribonucleoprotein 1-like [Salvia splendens]XP_042061695.1 heterogeneous nuclear ribonucleoprotein 1-like [Salvia splendens]
MEMDAGKLFIGGIPWDTSEDRLRQYFQAFGEVVEAVIMKDRATGRARGFGFIVFADASVAEKVVKEKHVIDGRTVEAKKAVPRDDHQNFNRNSGSIQGSPSHVRTKKIFVGGLPSTITESDFKKYFDQFGTITDVVVMYDHNTQRPRGFGFITYDSEEAVDKVLFKTFHELCGKMVEVKRAVPKELSPGPTRCPSPGYNYGLSRASSFLNAYSPGYNPNSTSGYGMRMDGRFSPVTAGRSGYPPYSPSNHNFGLTLDSGLGLNHGVSRDSGLGYGNGMNSYFSGDFSRYGSSNGYDLGSAGTGSFMSSTNRNMWGNGSPNFVTNSATSNDFIGTRTGNAGIGSGFGSIGEIWGRSPVSAKSTEAGSVSRENIAYDHGDNSFVDRASYTRENGGIAGSASFYSTPNNIYDENYRNLYGGSFNGDEAWRSSSQELEGSASYGYGRGSGTAEAASETAAGYAGGYNVRSDRGIAA